MNTTLLYGTGVALITPFKDDFSIDAQALSQVVTHVIKGGVNYMVVMGTTAESTVLTPSEKEEVKRIIKETNKGSVPMVLGIGGNNTDAVINELRTTDLTSYTAILSVVPYYNKPTQEGIYQHFKAIAQVASKPIILYNVPGRTAVNILPETVLRLANDCPKIIGIKEASGDLVQAMSILKNKPKDFLMISGDDMMALPIILAGGAGVISVVGQGFPEHYSQMVTQGLKGNVATAYALHYKLMDIISLIFEEGNPSGIKAVYEKLGIAKDTVRLPLVKTSNALKNKIDQFIITYKKQKQH